MVCCFFHRPNSVCFLHLSVPQLYAHEQTEAMLKYGAWTALQTKGGTFPRWEAVPLNSWVSAPTDANIEKYADARYREVNVWDSGAERLPARGGGRQHGFARPIYFLSMHATRCFQHPLWYITSSAVMFFFSRLLFCSGQATP